MEIDFWAQRWKEGRIGFHEGRTNTFLARHVDRIGTAPRRVLVPLCGKTEDMAFLASRGHEVVGIEAVEDAVKAFFREHELEPSVRELDGNIRAYSSGRVTLLAGDVFACTKEHVGDVDAFYDRAALVALPPDVRARYVAHVRGLLAPQSKGLLVTFDYDQSKFAPPPFAVGAEEVRRHYTGARVTLLDQGPLEGPRFREAGIGGTEMCILIEL
jgi:thiopurine S-methyltransferase